MAESSLVGASPGVEETSDCGGSEASLNDVDLSLQGITLLMNDKWDEAEALFNQHKEYSPLLSFGSSFVMVMQGIMSFEDEKLAAALASLKDTEKRCEIPTGFLKGVKKKKKRKEASLEDRLTRQIVVGDSLLYQAILTFIHQDLASYVKGGWLLRKAWKLYVKTHREISGIHERARAREPGSSVDAASVPGDQTDRVSLTSSSSSASQASSSEGTELSLVTAVRLLGSVSFGYGTLQLVISLVPPKVLKLIEFLGFDGDRPEGIRNLERASLARDMRAPLAMFALIWYHTVIRPFFALDGTNTNAGKDVYDI